MDWLVRSFHPILYDMNWLQQRFELFCQAKLQIDFTWAQNRLQHAPVHAKVIHKLFGRHNPIASILLHHQEDQDMFESYVIGMYGQKGIEKSMMETTKDRTALACALTGPLNDAKKIIKSLLRGGGQLVLDLLMLFELVHMTVFCKKEYESNTEPYHHWMISYICNLVDKVSVNDTSLTFAMECEGLQTQTLLKIVRSLLVSCQPRGLGHVHIQVGCGIEKDEDLDDSSQGTISHKAILNEMKGRLVVTPKRRNTHHKDL